MLVNESGIINEDYEDYCQKSKKQIFCSVEVL